MKKKNLYIILALSTLLMVQCKSVNVTWLGLINQEYTRDKGELVTTFGLKDPITNGHEHVAPDTPAVSITGKVTDLEEHPVAGLEVMVFIDNAEALTRHTDSLGIFQLGQTPAGIYTFILLDQHGGDTYAYDLTHMSGELELRLIFYTNDKEP